MPSHTPHTDKPLPVEPIELIAIDMDGTLLRSDDTVGAKTIRAIKTARQRGIHVVIASARPPRGVLKTYEQLELDSLQINPNGALIYDQHRCKTVHHQPLNAQLARDVVELARHVAPNIPVGVEVIDTLYTDRTGTSRRLRYGGVTGPTGSLEHVLMRPVTKIFMTGRTGQLSSIQMALQTKLSGRVGFAISHLRLLQIVRADVDKASALAKIAGHYGVAAQRIMAIGDAPNDLGMMNWAGLSIAVKNGWRDVLKTAHFVVPSNDNDGVAHAIEQYAL